MKNLSNLLHPLVEGHYIQRTINLAIQSYKTKIFHKKPMVTRVVLNRFKLLIIKYKKLYAEYLKSLKGRFLFYKSSASIALERALLNLQISIQQWISLTVK